MVLPELDGAELRADVILRARRSAYEADFAVLEKEVKEAVEEAVEDLCSREP
jgi:hypothetical protein